MASVYLCVCRDSRGEVQAASLGWRRPAPQQRERGWSDEASVEGTNTRSALRQLLGKLVPLLGTPVVEALPQGIRDRLTDLARQNKAVSP